MSGGSRSYDDTELRDEQARINQVLTDLGTYNQHRFDENVAERAMISGIEGINTTQSQQIKDLFTSTGDLKTTLDALTSYNQHRFDENVKQQSQIEDILKQLENVQSTSTGDTAVGDTSNLEEIVSNLQKQYEGLDSSMADRLSSLGETLKGELQNEVTGFDVDQLKTDLMNQFKIDDTTSQELKNLQNTFGSFQNQSVNNLRDVESALKGEIGDLSQSLTSGLSSLKSDAATALDTVYKTRDEALAGLSGDFGRRLREQEASFGKQMDDSAKQMDDKIGKLGSMMNYRMLGDSAGGVKMRRSKAFKSGAVQSGTGQLARTMKLKTLNI